MNIACIIHDFIYYVSIREIALGLFDLELLGIDVELLEFPQTHVSLALIHCDITAIRELVVCSHCKKVIGICLGGKRDIVDHDHINH